MSRVIFSESSHANDSRIGKLETALKVFIEKEADEVSKKKDYENVLFKTENSEHFAETYALSDGLGQWTAGPEGSTPENDSFGETFKKIIEHNEFRKGFVITKKMLDDCSATQIGVQAGDVARQFVNSYQETINYCLVNALTKANLPTTDLINGKYIKFNNGLVDVTTGDGKPLFAADHDYGLATLHGAGTQSNYFYVPSASVSIDPTAIEEVLNHLSVLMRNIKDENGNPMGYSYDTIIIPGDNYALETAIRKALGSGYLPFGTSNGADSSVINTQYGKKNLMVLPEWATVGADVTNEIILMSSEAKDKLHGNVFLQRVPMDVANEIDFDTRNWKWNGYARWGVGFGSYKHICRLAFSPDATQDTALSAVATSL